MSWIRRMQSGGLAMSLSALVGSACGSRPPGSDGDAEAGTSVDSGGTSPGGASTTTVDASGATTSGRPSTSVVDPGGASTTTVDTSGATTSGRPSGTKFDLGPWLDVGGWPVEPIPSTCAAASFGATSVGCEFFAVDLDQLDGLDELQFAVAVSNVQPSRDAEVMIEQKIAGAWAVVDGPVTIGPLTEHTFLLPDLHQEDSGLHVGGSYRIRADVPVVAYQFNPLNISPDSASSDASLLLPVSSWDHTGHVVGWEPLALYGAYGAYVTIAAAVDDTIVDVTPSIATDAGPGVPAGSPGVPMQFELDAGDTVALHITSDMLTLTGTRIHSDEEHPIAVFSGAECTFVLAYSCDHLEEQLTGVRRWGMEFVAARVPPRIAEAPETSVWQIYASEDATTVEFVASPAVTGVPPGPVQLDAGELVTLEVGGSAQEPGDFMVHADRPITVVNYMTGSSLAGEQGDPAMVQVPPVEQYMTRYVVLVPSSWTTDVITLTRSPGVAIVLDGAPVDDAAFVAVGAYEVARLPVADGVHVTHSEAPFGVVVTGYTTVDSYAYAGGLGTRVYNPDPEG